MCRTLVLCVCVLLSSAVVATAADVSADGQLVDRQSADARSADAQSGDAQSGDAQSGDAQSGDAQSGNAQSDAKKLSGMSIVGNDEAPKSLYIVPWKSSEIGAETSLETMLNEGDVPVDRDVFKRQLEFYRVTTGK